MYIQGEDNREEFSFLTQIIEAVKGHFLDQKDFGPAIDGEIFISQRYSIIIFIMSKAKIFLLFKCLYPYIGKRQFDFNIPVYSLPFD